ncbi:MAG: transcriptional regulator [Thermodesulfobacteriota bacterium]
MTPTLRQTILELLALGERSAEDLARTLLITPREVEEHLPHLARSHKGRLRVSPARCRHCGYVFSDRRRLDAPGRCPRCKREQVEGPWFSLAGPPTGHKC